MGKDYTVRIHTDTFRGRSLPEILHLLHRIFARMLEEIMGGLPHNTYGRFVIMSDDLDTSISVKMMPK
jgi:hypothetical protein